jgi:hypothetical protein
VSEEGVLVFAAHLDDSTGARKYPNIYVATCSKDMRAR